MQEDTLTRPPLLILDAHPNINKSQFYSPASRRLQISQKPKGFPSPEPKTVSRTQKKSEERQQAEAFSHRPTSQITAVSSKSRCNQQMFASETSQTFFPLSRLLIHDHSSVIKLRFAISVYSEDSQQIENTSHAKAWVSVWLQLRTGDTQKDQQEFSFQREVVKSST